MLGDELQQCLVTRTLSRRQHSLLGPLLQLAQPILANRPLHHKVELIQVFPLIPLSSDLRKRFPLLG